MRIATWNVNSVGARLPRLLDWLQTREPDVVALQETKTNEAGFPSAEVEALGYEVLHVGDGRWNGVAVLSRVGLEPVASSCPAWRSRPNRATPWPTAGACGTVSVYVPERPFARRPALRVQARVAGRPPAHAGRPRPGRTRW